MKSAPKFQQLIEDIAAKHDFNLHRTGAYLRLNLDGERLVIENIGGNRLSIAYQLKLQGNWISDPDVVFWMNHPASLAQWTPVEIYEAEGGWYACAEIDTNGQMIGFHRPAWQAWLADYVETEIVSNLTSQGWLALGVKSDEPPPAYTINEMRERGYLIEEEPFLSRGVLFHTDIPF